MAEYVVTIAGPPGWPTTEVLQKIDPPRQG